MKKKLIQNIIGFKIDESLSNSKYICKIKGIIDIISSSDLFTYRNWGSIEIFKSRNNNLVFKYIQN